MCVFLFSCLVGVERTVASGGLEIEVHRTLADSLDVEAELAPLLYSGAPLATVVCAAARHKLFHVYVLCCVLPPAIVILYKTRTNRRVVGEESI